MATLTRAERRRPERAGARVRPRGQRRWSSLAGATLLAALALAAVLGLPGGGASGALAAERTEHAFSTVRMQDGLLAASFPLAVEGAVYVTDLGTT